MLCTSRLSNAACGTYEHAPFGGSGSAMAPFWPICAQSTGAVYLSLKEANAKYASDGFLGYYTDYSDY